MAFTSESEHSEAVEFTAPDGSRWLRTGSCNQCGLCCEGDPTAGNVKGEVEGWCPYFRWLKEGKGGCSLHGKEDSYWANGCNVWPTEPDHLKQHPYCAFRFEKIE